MTLTVTVKDNETGETDSAQVPDGDYLIVCTDPATYSLQVHANGTHVITVTGVKLAEGEYWHAEDCEARYIGGEDAPIIVEACDCGLTPSILAIEAEARAASQQEIVRLTEANARLLTALRVSDHAGKHDHDGPEEPMSGWPTCSVCGAILDPHPAPHWRNPRAALGEKS